MTPKEELRRELRALGFDAVRFTKPGGAAPAALESWLAAGHQADMHWIERSVEKRLNPELVLPGARSMILLGVNYWSRAMEPVPAGVPVEGGAVRQLRPEPRWARYAQHLDYHDTMRPGLIAAGRKLEELFQLKEADYRYYTDTGPVLERGWAERAGLGFVGKNAMLISRDFGNWLLLAAILTRAEIEPDETLKDGRAGSSKRSAAAEGKEEERIRVGLLCGKCTRCIDSCPTQAIIAPGTIDARLCVSYQTIENKGVIPRELRAGIGLRIYGCDVCAEVCPWNRFAQEGRRVLLVARHDLGGLGLRDVLELTQERFAEVFRKTPIKRVKLAGLLRNACVVAGNLGVEAADCLDVLVRLAAHEKALVRVHAVWAVYRVAGTDEAAMLLSASRAKEADAAVLVEYANEAACQSTRARTSRECAIEN